MVTATWLPYHLHPRTAGAGGDDLTSLTGGVRSLAWGEVPCRWGAVPRVGVRSPEWGGSLKSGVRVPWNVGWCAPRVGKWGPLERGLVWLGVGGWPPLSVRMRSLSV